MKEILKIHRDHIRGRYKKRRPINEGQWHYYEEDPYNRKAKTLTKEEFENLKKGVHT